MTDIPPVRPARKLPVEIVVRRAFLFSWESRHILAGPSLIYAILTFVADLIVIHFAGSKDHPTIKLLAVVMPLISLAFAVGIHRFVLLGEAPPNNGFFHFDRYYVRYALLSIMLAVLAFLAAAPLIAAAGTGDPAAPQLNMDGTTALVGLATLALAAVVLTRLSLLLVSAAVGDQTRAKAIWEATQGNSLRLLAVGLITFLPFWMAEVALAQFIPENGDSLIGVLIALADAVLSPVRLIVLTVTLALCYDLLVRGNGPVVTDSRRLP